MFALLLFSIISLDFWYLNTVYFIEHPCQLVYWFRKGLWYTSLNNVKIDPQIQWFLKSIDERKLKKRVFGTLNQKKTIRHESSRPLWLVIYVGLPPVENVITYFLSVKQILVCLIKPYANLTKSYILDTSLKIGNSSRIWYENAPTYYNLLMTLD